jgi:hypothetical protein
MINGDGGDGLVHAGEKNQRGAAESDKSRHSKKRRKSFPTCKRLTGSP